MENPKKHSVELETKWHGYAPWFMTVLSILMLAVIGLFLWSNMEWFKVEALRGMDYDDKGYMLYIYHLQNSLMKRCLGFFTGFALAFVGCAVALYTVKDVSNLNLETGGSKLVLASASPGLFAMVLGILLMITTLVSKDTFPSFEPGSKQLSAPKLPGQP